MDDPDRPVRRALGFTLRDAGAAAPEAVAEFLKLWMPKTHRWVIREATKKLPTELRRAVLSSH